MSTLNVANISDGTDTVATGYVLNGSAKSWMNFNGAGTVAIRDSMNVSGVVDGGTGLYTMSYVSSLANGDYSIGDSSANLGLTLSQTYVIDASWLAVGSYKFYTMYASSFTGGGAVVDSSLVGVQIMGDLA